MRACEFIRAFPFVSDLQADMLLILSSVVLFCAWDHCSLCLQRGGTSASFWLNGYVPHLVSFRIYIYSSNVSTRQQTKLRSGILPNAESTSEHYSSPTMISSPTPSCSNSDALPQLCAAFLLFVLLLQAMDIIRVKNTRWGFRQSDLYLRPSLMGITT